MSLSLSFDSPLALVCAGLVRLQRYPLHALFKRPWDLASVQARGSFIFPLHPLLGLLSLAQAKPWPNIAFRPPLSFLEQVGVLMWGPGGAGGRRQTLGLHFNKALMLAMPPQCAHWYQHGLYSKVPSPFLTESLAASGSGSSPAKLQGVFFHRGFISGTGHLGLFWC